MDYQWDAPKARINRAKHGVDFSDAIGVFEDLDALTIEPQWIDDEMRYVTMGMDFLGRILVVVYTLRGEQIRLISARRVTPRERATYERRQRI